MSSTTANKMKAITYAMSVIGDTLRSDAQLSGEDQDALMAELLALAALLRRLAGFVLVDDVGATPEVRPDGMLSAAHLVVRGDIGPLPPEPPGAFEKIESFESLGLTLSTIDIPRPDDVHRILWFIEMEDRRVHAFLSTRHPPPQAFPVDGVRGSLRWIDPIAVWEALSKEEGHSS